MTAFRASTAQEKAKILSLLKNKNYQNILLIENASLLPPLRLLLQDANIYATSSEEESSTTWEELDVKGTILDHEREVLPYEKNFFDLIIAPHVFEKAQIPGDIAYGFKEFLKDEGVLLTSFFNVRSFHILEALQCGFFPLFNLHAFTRREIEALFFSVFYEEIAFLPVRFPLPKAKLAPFEALHFLHIDELSIEAYVVMAHKEQSKIVELKKTLAKKERQHLQKLIYRLAYDIESEESLTSLWQHIKAKKISLLYLLKFILLLAPDKEKVIRILLDASEEGKAPFTYQELLRHFYEEALFLRKHYGTHSETLTENPIKKELLSFLRKAYRKNYD